MGDGGVIDVEQMAQSLVPSIGVVVWGGKFDEAGTSWDEEGGFGVTSWTDRSDGDPGGKRSSYRDSRSSGAEGKSGSGTSWGRIISSEAMKSGSARNPWKY
jgi:hypothetical protein